MNARLYEAIGPMALATLVAGAAIVFAPDHRAVVAHVYVLVVGALLVRMLLGLVGDLLPSRRSAFEDSLVGVQAAQAARVPVVGVPTVVQDGFAPDFLFGSLADPVLQAWAAAL